jgi:hypothetical protein
VAGLSTRALLLGLLAASTLISAAWAARPRGDANYVATDSRGRPAITLWMRTDARMIVFVCYRWGRVDHGDHLNNSHTIRVPSSGAFSYAGPARNLHGKTFTIKFSGRFVTRDKAVGVMTAPCMSHRRFTARLAR